jgi:hypothetical protein
MLFAGRARGLDLDQSACNARGVDLAQTGSTRKMTTLPAMPSASHFDQLLQAACGEPDPQRLLFVFAQAELPEGATEEQKKNFLAGKGGALTPLACVDKAPGDLSTFEALANESRHACPPWQIVFIAALAGQDGKPPSSALVDSALQAMVAAVKAGRFGNYMALAADGQPLVLS